MKTQDLIDHMGSAKAMAELFDITPGAVSQWGEDIPDAREWQLRVIRPDLFKPQAKQEATNGAVRCEDLRPDVRWDVLRANPAVAATQASEA